MRKSNVTNANKCIKWFKARGINAKKYYLEDEEIYTIFIEIDLQNYIEISQDEIVERARQYEWEQKSFK